MAAVAAMVTATAGGPANSTGMSLNYVLLPEHVTLDACLNLAENQLANTGLDVLQRTTSAAWAQPMNTNLDQIFSVYCIVDRGIALIAGAGEDLDSIDATMSQVFGALDYAFNGK
jgi:hypothetical protein